ncbi:hypothetical protein BASA62_005915 [Batrachochytrium salamandrivorans]|nr:hypothetical protein BASA62_005915 [Batrachochytrium salamandrivorans]
MEYGLPVFHGFDLTPMLIQHHLTSDHRSQVARQQSTLCKGIGCKIASDGGCPVADGSLHQPSLQDTASKGTDLTEGTRLCQLGADDFETLRGGQTTFYGSGQLIGYPIIDLRTFDASVICKFPAIE